MKNYNQEASFAPGPDFWADSGLKTKPNAFVW